MAETDLLVKEKVDSSGIFNFSDLYGFVHAWLLNENYGVVEDKYSEKISGEKKDITAEWTVSKNTSDYFKMMYKMKFEARGLSDVEVEIDGAKKKMNKGSILFEIKGALTRDPESKWDTTPFNRFIRDIYNKYVIPKRVDSMKYKVFEDARDLKEQVKSFLDLTGRR